MHKLLFLLILALSSITFSYDVGNFYNFQLGTEWHYNYEHKDTSIMGCNSKQSIIICVLNKIIVLDTAKTFILEITDSITAEINNGIVTDTSYTIKHSDTITIVIKGKYSYCLYPESSLPYYCPYLPFCTNISDTTGTFTTENNTLYYSRENDKTWEMSSKNNRKWSSKTGCTSSYTHISLIDNHIITRATLIRFIPTTANIKKNKIAFFSKSFTIQRLQLHLHPSQKLSSGSFVRYNGKMFTLDGKKIKVSPIRQKPLGKFRD